AYHGDDVFAAGEHPGNSDLRDGGALRFCDSAEGLDEGEVAVEVFGTEPRRMVAEVAGIGRARLRRVAADEAAREQDGSGDANAECAAGRQNLALDAAGDQRVLDLEIDDLVHGGGAADGLHTDLRETDLTHVARLHHLGNCAHGLLDGDVG